MPYKLRKAPKRDLYWVVTIETGKKHSKDPISKDKAKAQLRILESALKGGVSLRMPKKPNQNGKYEMRDINGNLLTIVNTKQEALDALALWFKFDEFQALAEILSKIDQLLLMPQMTPLIYKLLDELVTSYKNIAEKFLSTSKNERQKAQVRHILNTDIAGFASEAGHPDFSVETIGQGKKKCHKCGLPIKLKGGFGVEEAKTILRRAIRYIYSQGNNMAYYASLFAAAIATDRLTHGNDLELLFRRIFPEWFSRLLIAIGHTGSAAFVLETILEPLDIQNANPELGDPTAVIRPPQPSWLERIFGRRREDPGHLHQD